MMSSSELGTLVYPSIDTRSRLERLLRICKRGFRKLLVMFRNKLEKPRSRVSPSLLVWLEADQIAGDAKEQAEQQSTFIIWHHQLALTDQ
jgi:hypothetical protein